MTHGSDFFLFLPHVTYGTKLYYNFFYLHGHDRIVVVFVDDVDLAGRLQRSVTCFCHYSADYLPLGRNLQSALHFFLLLSR